jgi:Zn-dependent protease
MKNKMYNFDYRGVHLSIHWTFILLIIWLIMTNILTGLSGSGWIWSIIMVLSLIVSIFIHDVAQATVGTICGIEISGLMILPIGGLPSLANRPKKKIYELYMLAAGPAVNLGLAVLLMSFLHPYKAYWNEPENIGVAYPGNFIFQLQFINLSLGLLNLLPAFPMDGGRALDTLLEKKYSTLRAKKIVRIFSLLIAFGFLLTGLIYLNFTLFIIGLFIVFTARMGKYYHPLNKIQAQSHFNIDRLQPLKNG